MLSVPAHPAAETDEALVTFGTYQTLEYWTITTSALPLTILSVGTPGVCLMSYQAELISICMIFQCIYTLVYLFIYPILIVNHAQNAPTSLSRFMFFK